MLKMKAFYIFLSIVLIFFALVIFIFALKSHKFFKTLFLNAFIGLSVLAIIDLTGKYTGIFLPINWYSVCGASVFGIPAVCGFLVLQIIFI